MATLIYNESSDDILRATRFDVDEVLNGNGSEYSYTNVGGQIVTLIGYGFTYLPGGIIDGGTVTSLTISVDGTNLNEYSLTASDISIDATEIANNPGTGTDIINAILEGESELISNGANPILNGVDGADIDSGTVYGHDNSVTGTYPTNLSLGVRNLEGDGTYFGGNSTVEADFKEVTGDTRYVEDTATLIGGDDTIVWTNLGYVTSNIYMSGDSFRATDDSTVIGGDDVLDGREGTSTYRISGDLEQLGGNATLVGGDDIIYGAATNGTQLYGDVFNRSGLGTTLIGGDDIIYGGSSGDTITGDTAINDTLSYAGGDDTIFGGGGDDTIYGQNGRDRITVGNGSSEVYGGRDDDYIKIDGNGSHSVSGGSGIDKLSLSSSNSGVTVNLATGAASGGKATNLTFSSIENISGSDGGRDTITGSNADNEIKTYGGDDTVFGSFGDDKIVLGNGNDFVLAGEGANIYYGESGTDTISYYDSAAGVTIDLQNKTASGGLAEGDKVGGFEIVLGSSFNDDIKGSNGVNTVRANGGQDTINGRDGNDKLYGGGQDDRINGGKNNDSLYGGKGEDRLDGDVGNDKLWGGNSADTFHFDKNDDKDIIKDFQNNVDTIEIDGYSAGYNAMSRATQVGSDVVFNFGSGDTLTVENTTIGQLTNDLDVV